MPPNRVSSRIMRVAVVMTLLFLTGCPFIPPELRSLKSPIKWSPPKHEATVQPASGMGPAPFKIDQAQARAAEATLTLSNPTTSPIRVVWTGGWFIAADSIVYSIGVKTDRDRVSTEPTTIEANSSVRVTVVALTADGKPVASVGKSLDPPYRVGLKLVVERLLDRWRGTVWVFVS